MTAISQDQNSSPKDWIQSLFTVYESGLNGHSQHPIALFRKAAFQQFSELEFPTRRDEDWKYTGLNRILQHRFQVGNAHPVSPDQVEPFLFPNLDVIRIVFTNGILNRELSQLDALPHGLEILTVEEALKNESCTSWMQEQINLKGGTGRNTFLPLNRAFAGNGIFIRTAKKVRIEKPIHLLYLSVSGNEPHFAHPQCFVWAQSQSELTVLESYHSLHESGVYFNNAANWIDVESNAQVSHYRLQLEGKEAFQVNNTLVRQERDSRYSSYAVDFGGRMVRNNLSTLLLDSGTETNFFGTYLGKDEQHIDNQTFIDHAMPHCESNELYKGILTDRARGVFNGKVMVRQDAQKTNAFQQNSSLVLSSQAVMDAKPQLEIFADDVRCSHGATIGQLDEGSVFYLRSRGIPEQKAKHLLQKAFVGEVIEKMPIEAIRETVYALMEEKLGEG